MNKVAAQLKAIAAGSKRQKVAGSGGKPAAA